MTEIDFKSILINSFTQIDKVSYIERQRQGFGCVAAEYIHILLLTYEKLEHELNQIDYECYTVTEQDGNVLKGKLGRPVDDYNNEREEIFHELRSMGELTFPVKKFLILKSSNRLGAIIDSENVLEIKMGIDDYITYIHDKEAKRKDSQDSLASINQFPDHSELFNALQSHISGISSEEFSNVINHFLLSPGTPKAKWNGEKVDACYFTEYLGMAYAKWNKCFAFKDLKPLLKHNRDILQKGSPVLDLLKLYLPK